MASVVDICNLALLRIGQDEIQSLNESSVEAQYCRRFYDRCRRVSLRAHPWNFATKTDSPALLASSSDEYDYVFQLPPDCIRALKILGGTDDAPIKFQVRGRLLETDEAAPVLKYIWNVEDPNLFDESYIEALSLKLAAEVALPVTGKADLSQLMEAKFEKYIRMAQAMDMNEGHKPAETNQSFVDARA